MRPEERGMMGKEDVPGKGVNHGKNMPDERKRTEITEKVIHEMNDIGMDAYRKDICCKGERIKPPDTLLTEQQA